MVEATNRQIPDSLARFALHVAKLQDQRTEDGLNGVVGADGEYSLHELGLEIEGR